MKTSRIRLICTLMVVGLGAVAYAGLTANQAGWSAQIGAGVCDYRAVAPWPPQVPPRCNPNCDDNGQCRNTSSQGYDGYCFDTGVFQDSRAKGTELSHIREKTERICPRAIAPRPNADGDLCACGDNRDYSHTGDKLKKCVLSSC